MTKLSRLFVSAIGAATLAGAASVSAQPAETDTYDRARDRATEQQLRAKGGQKFAEQAAQYAAIAAKGTPRTRADTKAEVLADTANDALTDILSTHKPTTLSVAEQCSLARVGQKIARETWREFDQMGFHNSKATSDLVYVTAGKVLSYKKCADTPTPRA